MSEFKIRKNSGAFNHGSPRALAMKNAKLSKGCDSESIQSNYELP